MNGGATPSKHQQQREALASFVVGALDPAERREIEQHLQSCRSCTDELARLTPLPGLLARVSEQEVRGDLLVPSQDLLDGVIQRLGDTERVLRVSVRRWRAVAVAACMVALVVTVVAIAPWQSEPDRLVVDGAPAPGAPAQDITEVVSGQVAAIAWEWGTTVELSAADLPARDGYVLWAVSTDGQRERAGTWGVTTSGDARVRGASSIPRSQLDRIEVTDRDGELIMIFEFDAPAA